MKEDISQEWQDRIERFLEHKMSDQEKVDFIANIKENKDAIELLNEAILEKQLLEGLIRNDLKNQFNQINQLTKTQNYPRSYWQYIILIILILILIVATWYWYGRITTGKQQEAIEQLKEIPEEQNKTEENKTEDRQHKQEENSPLNNGKKIAKVAYQKPEVFAMILRGERIPQLNIEDYEEAVMQFQENKYKEALESIQKFSRSKNLEGEPLFLRGHIYFNLGRYESAETDFSTLSENNYSPYQDEAKWYLMLSLLGQEKYQLATKIKKELEADTSSEHQEAAKRLKWK